MFKVVWIDLVVLPTIGAIEQITAQDFKRSVLVFSNKFCSLVSLTSQNFIFRLGSHIFYE